MELLGRENEIEIFEHCQNANESKLVAVYGRRRIGKTFLIRNHFGKVIDFEITALKNGVLQDQLNHFATTLVKLGYYQATLATPKSWMMAFQLLADYIDTLPKKKKKVIFIDEMPWFDTPKSKFLMAFENFWNSYCTARRDVLIIICGSAASWMINKVLKNKGGLHNRVSEKIKLKPFTLYETKLFLTHKGILWTEYEMAQMYMVSGGIPFYLDAVRKGESVMQFIERACFKENGVLTNEFAELFASLFKESIYHEQLVSLLAKHKAGLTREEILLHTKWASGGALTKLLDELEESSFIKKTFPFNTIKRKAVYLLDDFFTQFYFKFMDKKKQSFQTIILHSSWVIWTGFAFERLCIYHIEQLKKALGLNIIATNQFSYRGKDDTNKHTQIDLIIERADRILHICEMKFSIGKFVIDKAYSTKLRDKLAIYQAATKTKQTIFLTMITTFGIAKNEYSNSIVQNEVLLKKLFMK